MWGGQTVEQVEHREKQAINEAKARYDAYQASKNAPAQVGWRWRAPARACMCVCVCVCMCVCVCVILTHTHTHTHTHKLKYTQ